MLSASMASITDFFGILQKRAILSFWSSGICSSVLHKTTSGLIPTD